METLAKRLVQARKDRGISQQELAKTVGVAQSAISSIELGITAKPGNIVSIAKAIGVTPGWLMTGEESPINTEICQKNLAMVIEKAIEEINAAGLEATPVRIARISSDVYSGIVTILAGQPLEKQTLDYAFVQALKAEFES